MLRTLFLATLIVLAVVVRSAAPPEPPKVQDIKLSGQDEEDGSSPGLTVHDVREIRMPPPDMNFGKAKKAKATVKPQKKAKAKAATAKANDEL
jgi:hypothetical protein